MTSKFSYKVEELSAEEQSCFQKVFADDYDVYVRINGCVLPKNFLSSAEENVGTVPLRTSDVFVVTFPRSGTTWTQELVWLLSNNLDFEKAKNEPLVKRFPFLEHYIFDFASTAQVESENQRKIVESRLGIPAAQHLAKVPEGEPRFIKTHLPLSLLPQGALDTTKVVYVARDPRDVAVSCYHFFRSFKKFGVNCDFKTFYNEVFSRELMIWAPYFKHVKEAWAARNRSNYLFIFYEELFKDLKGTAKKVSKFLGKEYTEEQFDRLCEHLRFDNFKSNKAVIPDDLVYIMKTEQTNFIRKGKSGGWREHFDAEMTVHAEAWIEDNLRDTDLRFPQV